MKKPGWLWLVLFIALAWATGTLNANSACFGDYAAGIVLVGWRGGDAAIRQLGREPRARLPGVNVTVVRVPSGQECATVEALRRDARVAFAELDYAVHADAATAQSPGIIPNDPGWGSQWGLAKIHAPEAWRIVTGTANVVIAILDSGVYPQHPDLAAKLWTNPGEISANGLDDDSNGKIDDIHGWHFFHRYYNGEYYAEENADIRDDYGHGTHVAGIAAAAANNGIGVAGVAWGAPIMVIKVLDQYGNGWYSDVAAGIIYAADNGARVINLSLGGAPDSETLRAAVDYALSKNGLVIAAAGNTGGTVLYPAAYDPVLAVAAIDANDQRANFSNYGPQIDLTAPGVNIYSTWYLGNYFTKTGTSMAAPHVAGTAALVWARRPALRAGEVISQLVKTADDIGELGADPYTGWGRINAYRAVSELEPLPDLWVHLSGPQFIHSGESFSYTLAYGNHGASAVSVTLLLRLATGLTSSLPTTWAIGSVPAHSISRTRILTATPQCATLCLGSNYTTTATIQDLLADWNSYDNAALWVTHIPWPTFLPVVLKPAP
jgi:subtilisin family serine protease